MTVLLLAKANARAVDPLQASPLLRSSGSSLLLADPGLKRKRLPSALCPRAQPRRVQALRAVEPAEPGAHGSGPGRHGGTAVPGCCCTRTVA